MTNKNQTREPSLQRAWDIRPNPPEGCAPITLSVFLSEADVAKIVCDYYRSQVQGPVPHFLGWKDGPTKSGYEVEFREGAG